MTVRFKKSNYNLKYLEIISILVQCRREGGWGVGAVEISSSVLTFHMINSEGIAAGQV